MRSRLGWILGLVVLAALWARRRARGSARAGVAAVAGDPAPAAPDSRAAELREKLAQAREAAADRDAFEEGETTVDAASGPGDRRREVHERGRAAIDDMASGG